MLFRSQVNKITLFDPSDESIEQFSSELGDTLAQSEVSRSTSIEDCVAQADVIVTTTPSREALITPEMVKPGAHINAIGADAPGKQELSLDIIKSAYIVVDDIKQASHSGEINKAITQNLMTEDGIHATLPDIVAGLTTITRSADQIGRAHV